MKDLAIIALLIALGIAVLSVAHMRSESLKDSAETYTACVERQYGMSPHEWRAKTGELPECK